MGFIPLASGSKSQVKAS